MSPVDVGMECPLGWAPVTIAKDQPEYEPLPALRCRDGRLVTRWRPTDEERKRIADGQDVFLTIWTCHQPLQPLLMTIGGAMVERIPLQGIES